LTASKNKHRDAKKKHRVKLSSQFESRFKRHPDLRDAIKKALTALVDTPERKSLNLEPLTGRPGFWSIRINNHFRILLHKLEDETGVYFLAVDFGNHETYRKK
jgi:plasmid maintenance system killer protein